MIPMYLYSSDLRAIHYVNVPFPMPRKLLHSGKVFTWNSDYLKYIEDDRVGFGSFSNDNPIEVENASDDQPRVCPY